MIGFAMVRTIALAAMMRNKTAPGELRAALILALGRRLPGRRVVPMLPNSIAAMGIALALAGSAMGTTTAETAATRPIVG